MCGNRLNEPSTRKGYMTEAVRCILDYSFGPLKLPG